MVRQPEDQVNEQKSLVVNYNRSWKLGDTDSSQNSAEEKDQSSVCHRLDLWPPFVTEEKLSIKVFLGYHVPKKDMSRQTGTEVQHQTDTATKTHWIKDGAFWLLINST